jgi:hypothetical protein
MLWWIPTAFFLPVATFLIVAGGTALIALCVWLTRLFDRFMDWLGDKMDKL